MSKGAAGEGSDGAIQPLSDSYHRARKAYVTASVVLAAWELLGIEVGEASVNSIGMMIKIESPDAVPYALIAVIVYLGYRLFVEWQQCNAEQKALRLARFDYGMIHTLALLSVLFYLYQATRNVQIAEAFDLDVPAVAVAGAYIGIVVANIFQALREAWRTDRRVAFGLVIILLLIIAGGVIASLYRPKFVLVASAVAVGSALFKVLRYYLGWTEDRTHRLGPSS